MEEENKVETTEVAADQAVSELKEEIPVEKKPAEEVVEE